MAITLIREVWDDRIHELAEGGVVILIRSFVVTTDSGEVSPSVVSGASLGGVSIPAIGDNLRDSDGVDLGVTCRAIKTRPHKSPKTWWVDCRYSNHAGDGSAPQGVPPSEGDAVTGGGQGTAQGYPPGFGGGASGEGAPNQTAELIENPLLRPARVRYVALKYQEVVERDNANLTVRNAAGDPFDPPVQIERARLGMTVSLNQALFDPETIRDFVGSVNSHEWAGLPAYAVRMVDLDSGDRTYENGVWFWPVVYTFAFHPSGWNPVSYLNQGANYKLNGKLVRFTDDKGTPLRNGLLTATGGKLAVGGTPTFVDYDVYPEADFRQLKLFGRRNV